MGWAAEFLNENLAKEIADMKPNDGLVIGENNWAMAEQGRTYLLYLKNGGEATVDLSQAIDKEFSVKWFNPRSGGDMIDGTISTVKGSSEIVSLGFPPNTPEQDWLVLLKAKE